MGVNGEVQSAVNIQHPTDFTRPRVMHGNSTARVEAASVKPQAPTEYSKILMVDDTSK